MCKKFLSVDEAVKYLACGDKKSEKTIRSNISYALEHKKLTKTSKDALNKESLHKWVAFKQFKKMNGGYSNWVIRAIKELKIPNHAIAKGELSCLTGSGYGGCAIPKSPSEKDALIEKLSFELYKCREEIEELRPDAIAYRDRIQSHKIANAKSSQ